MCAGNESNLQTESACAFVLMDTQFDFRHAECVPFAFVYRSELSHILRGKCITAIISFDDFR